MAKDKQIKEVKENDIFAEAKEKRRLAYEASEKISAKEDSREEFRKFFIKLKGKLNLASDMEVVIWNHLQSIGADKKEKFEEGIKHFGYEL